MRLRFQLFADGDRMRHGVMQRLGVELALPAADDHGGDTVADQETELLHFGLPDLRGLEARPAYTAEAAE